LFYNLDFSRRIGNTSGMRDVRCAAESSQPGTALSSLPRAVTELRNSQEESAGCWLLAAVKFQLHQAGLPVVTIAGCVVLLRIPESAAVVVDRHTGVIAPAVAAGLRARTGE